jgi:XTP/dITP diphosphohydrolase
VREEAVASLRALNETMERLRAPGGCPWDRVQTHMTLRPYLLEETYEALEAIEEGKEDTLREELGDLLLQVFMHSAIAQERPDGFDVGEVADTARAKMIARHPHVFADVEVGGAADVVVNWERIKSREKGERLSLLDGVPVSLPALAYALGVQKRPARVGFDETPTLDDALTRTRDALEAAATEARQSDVSVPRGTDWVVDPEATPAADHGAGPPPPPPHLEEAIGDLLFDVVALARRLRVNPEDALRRRAHRYADRFRTLESQARSDGADLHDLSADEWKRRWEATGSAAPQSG